MHTVCEWAQVYWWPFKLLIDRVSKFCMRGGYFKNELKSKCDKLYILTFFAHNCEALQTRSICRGCGVMILMEYSKCGFLLLLD